MPKLKLFYSWQSDIPSTRSFIRGCIDEAIDFAEEFEAIEAERDEATKNMMGSPDIVNAICSKIEDCDLFVADLSLCFSNEIKTKDNTNKVKRSPNPNVLFELGYAVKTITWDRVICLCNNDYGTDYPFDIDHNRITGFSLNKSDRQKEKRRIAKIIYGNIIQLKNLPKRAKNGMALHVIGMYDQNEKMVKEALLPVEIEKRRYFNARNNSLLEKSKKIFDEIRDLKVKPVKTEEDRFKELIGSGEMPSLSYAHMDGILEPNYLDVYRPFDEQIASLTKAKKITVVWDSVDTDTELVKKWLNEEVPDGFFNLGGLTRVIQPFGIDNEEFEGTEEEKKKYEKLTELSYNLTLIDIRHRYLKTFNNMMFIPLAIQNNSAVLDTEIRVVVKVDVGEIVNPDETLICDDCSEMQPILCRDDDDGEDIGIIAELFALHEDGVIHIEKSRGQLTPYSKVKIQPLLFGMKKPEKNEDDYRDELEEFIATSAGNDYYEFEISSLRPGECRWFEKGMLIVPFEGSIKIHYMIHSVRTSGNICGELEYSIE